MKISSLCLLGFALAAPFVGAAAEGPGANSRPPIEELRKNVERWKALPQAERDRIKASYRQYKGFKDDQRAAVGENFRKFRNLSPERRRELSKKFEGLPPQQRERIAHQLRKLQQQGADRRNMAIAFARMARSLSPEQRRQLEQLENPEDKRRFLGRVFREHVGRLYLADKSAEQRAAFEALAPQEKKRILQQHFKERVMRGPPERGGPK